MRARLNFKNINIKRRGTGFGALWNSLNGEQNRGREI